MILGADARPQRARPRRPGPPLEAHPVVEENSVNTQLSEAPVRESSGDGTSPSIRIARDAPRTPRRRPSASATTWSSSRTCRASTARSVPFAMSTSRSRRHAITALIGPSGCGKSTLLRTINRMNDLVPSYRSEGRILLDGQDLFGQERRSGRRSAARRDGLPEAEPVPQDGLGERRVRSEDQRLQGRPQRARRDAACGGPRCGTTSRTSSSSPAWRCQAASSSVYASPGPSRSILR